MAWRLTSAGYSPRVVLVEKRSRMATGRNGLSAARVWHLGVGFFWKRFCEMVGIKMHFWARKLLGKHFRSPVYLSIEEWALDHPAKIYWVNDHNSRRVAEILRRFKPDVGVLTNTRRIAKEILSIPRHGFLNLHLSDLPKYAGVDSIFWALYHGESEIGVTIHFADERIDRGDILLQRKIPVSIQDNEDSLYEKALWLGTSLMAEALKQLDQGSTERRPQNGELASYFSWPTSAERREFGRRLRALDKKGPRFLEHGKPRVLHLITRMIRGGAQENTLATVIGLRERGYEVTLATGPSWAREGDLLAQALESGVEVVILPDLVRSIHPWKDLKSFFRILKLLDRGRYDLVHTHTSKAGVLGRLAARVKGVPLILHTPHGHVFHSYFSWWEEKVFVLTERFLARICDRLIALTHAEAREHRALEVGREEQWVRIPSGVHEADFCFSSRDRLQIRSTLGVPEDGTVVGFVGRLDFIKGPRYLVKAIPQILERHSETHFLFVGDGAERRRLEENVQVLGLGDHARFVGSQTRISPYLSALDILVVPSLNEGMGRVIVQAGLCGIPVVASDVGGIPDLIEPMKTGVLVKPRSAAQIAEAVVRLAKDPLLRSKLGLSLKEKVLGGFTEAHMIEKISSLYETMLSEKSMVRHRQEEGGLAAEEVSYQTVHPVTGERGSDGGGPK